LQTAADEAGHLNNVNFVDLFTNNALWSDSAYLMAHEFLTFLTYAIFTALVFAPAGIDGAGLNVLGDVVAGSISAFGNTLSQPSQR
jgi:hypothetical protein